ncbi:hypothetical protein [Amycolatopsis pithecellobii]|uniref:Uncharacterized protein n=1 Tax=Amycolatopsis pithecellobii TaxID=664692 RepID=A0A6N7YUZ5_9PSEU|nr:hypothetical protein [Amycolatopsis pithecellobii]MTD55738.1 hypothetical protein [Amycolatopsis pithecellobii]
MQVVRFPDSNPAFTQVANGTVDAWVIPLTIGQKDLDENLPAPLAVGYTKLDKEPTTAWAVVTSDTGLRNELDVGPTDPLPAESEPGWRGLPATNH